MWNDFLYEYRMNGNLIYAIYAVNYIMVFLFGGLFASDYPADPAYTIINLLFAVIGLSIILEQQALILGKMILDLRNEKERYEILFQIGMEQNRYCRLIRDKIRRMLIWPMDETSGQMVMELLVRLQKSLYKTLVLVTHDKEIADYCSRLVVMKDGRMAVR